MSEGSTVDPHPETNPTDSLPPPPKSGGESPTASQNRDATTPKQPGGPERKEQGVDAVRPPSPGLPGSFSSPCEGESPAVSQDQPAPTPGQSEGPEKETERRGDLVESKEVRRLRREIEDLKDLVNWERADAKKLKEGLTAKCKQREDWIKKMEREIGEMHVTHQRVVELQAQHIRAVEQRLKQTEELLATRTAELSGTHTFLSTTDRLSEDEVLDVVRDLNERIYQVAVRLTDEWEKLEPPPATNPMDVDASSQPQVPALVQLVRDRNPLGLTFLFQSCLCSEVVAMTSSWGRHQELAVLETVYQNLSASEGQAISARWRSLTHNHLPRPPTGSALLMEQLAKVVDETGSFSSAQESLEFVQAMALEGVEAIIRLALRSELAFMVEVKSSDMALLFEPPGTEFDGARMADEFGSGGAPNPERKDRIAATIEVGVRKSVCGGSGEGRRVGILLKTKVVLERDIVESGEQR